MRKKILGITDDEDTCCCCGKTGLKRVVFIEDGDTGEIAWFGTTCATKQMGALFGKASDIERAARTADKERKAAIQTDYRASDEFKAKAARERQFGELKEKHNLKPGLRHFKAFERFNRKADAAAKAKLAEITAKHEFRK